MKTYFILLRLIILSFSLSAQYQVITIDNNSSPNEPAIMINPYNTNEIVAGANIDSYYYSHDGGYSWIEGFLSSTNGVWGDPSIACDVNGDFYYFHLSNPDNGNWVDRIVCQKSSDAGENWNNGSYAGLNGTKVQDKEWPAIDRVTNNIYVTWTEFDDYGSSNPNDSSRIMFSKSENAGATWSQAIRINQTSGDCFDDDNTVEGAVPAVGSDGEIYVAWAGKKTDGANAIMFDKSTDYGNTWLDEDVFVTDFPGGWAYDIPGIYRCNGLPILKCDTSGGTNNGTLYINWTDQQNGTDNTDVWLVKSLDGGNTWSSKIRVNNDDSNRQQFFTWMDIDQTNGKLYFVFYDRRNYTDNNTDVFMAVSDDGGETFTNTKISETPFNPSASVFFGDYTCISAHNDKIAPIWARADGSTLSLKTIVPDNIGIINNTDLGEQIVFPNPSDDEFYFSFKLRKEQSVSLSVYDITGKMICSIINNELMTAGKYVKTFKASKYNLSDGVYFFKFSDGKNFKFNKIVYKL